MVIRLVNVWHFQPSPILTGVLIFSVATGRTGPDGQEQGGHVCTASGEEMANLLQQEEGKTDL